MLTTSLELLIYLFLYGTYNSDAVNKININLIVTSSKTESTHALSVTVIKGFLPASIWHCVSQKLWIGVVYDFHWKDQYHIDDL